MRDTPGRGVPAGGCVFFFVVLHCVCELSVGIFPAQVLLRFQVRRRFVRECQVVMAFIVPEARTISGDNENEPEGGRSFYVRGRLVACFSCEGHRLM